MKLNWIDGKAGDYLEAHVAARDFHQETGEYVIVIERRPIYCDRGNWIVKVFSHGILPLDDQEGFPRYYFDLDRAKAEMEDWCDKRSEVIKS